MAAEAPADRAPAAAASLRSDKSLVSPTVAATPTSPHAIAFEEATYRKVTWRLLPILILCLLMILRWVRSRRTQGPLAIA